MKKKSVSRRALRRQTFSCRPHYEVLEARLPLGDVLLGSLWASSLAGASMTGAERDSVDGGLSVLLCEDLELTSVELDASFRPKGALRAAGIDEGQKGDASCNPTTAEFVATPMSATAPVRAMSSLSVWHAFAPADTWLTAPDQGGAKAWHPAVARPEPAPPTGSQALPGNRLPQSSATSPRGGASRAVRSQAEPGNEAGEVAERYGNMPLSFEANHGQTDARVDFIARTGAYTAFLTPTGAVFSITQPVSVTDNLASVDASARRDLHAEHVGLTPRRSPQTTGGVALHMQIVGANPNATPIGQQPLPGIVNYFIGNDPSQWHANIPTFGRVEYQDLYPGIDLAYYGAQPSAFSDQPSESNGPRTTDHGPSLEYDFIVSPGADPNAIALNFAGADDLEINRQGDLIIHTAAGELVQQKPYLYQDVNGTRQEVAGEFRIQNSEFRIEDSELKTQNSKLVTFDVGAYDASRLLVIDPLVLGYSTYLGAGGAIDFARDIAVDADGHAYVTGETRSAKFPATSGAFDETFNGAGIDGFVAKLNGDGSGLIYASFLGGEGTDGAAGIALDEAGNAYIAGSTHSTDFPTTPGSFDVSFNSNENGSGVDAFATKLSADGTALGYSTYLGTPENDGASEIAVDPIGSAYLIGGTSSTDFPTTVGAFDTSYNGGLKDVFVAKLNPEGSALTYSTYVGGLDREDLTGIAIDTHGNAYVTGGTDSVDFPTTSGAFDQTYNREGDAFVAKLSADGTELLYSTFLGGDEPDGGNSIALDADGNFYVAGNARSNDFPITPGAFDTTPAFSNLDGFITKFSSSGAVVYSTFLSEGAESAKAIAVDSEQNAYVTGSARTNLALTLDAFDLTYNGGTDAFLLKLNMTGSALVYSTYLGGSIDDDGLGIALQNGDVYLAGRTHSSNFPTTPNAFKRRNRANTTDAFVTKFAEM